MTRSDRLEEIRKRATEERPAILDWWAENVTWLLVEVERLEKAVRATEWGCCDGCNNGHNFCPACKASREGWSDSDEPVIGQHAAGCIVGEALRP